MARMRAKDRRRQLLEVAAEMFASRGYRGTTTSELARAAGITEPILYRHFKNKLDLFITLITEVGKEVTAAWENALEGVKHPVKRLRILLAGNPATHERGRGIYRLIFQAMTEAESDPAIARALRKHMALLHKFIEKEIAALQKAGAVRKDEPAAAMAWLLMNVAVGYGLTMPLRVPGQKAATSRKSMQKLIEELVIPTAETRRQAAESTSEAAK
jgi:AcrR family transcriptional regulator